MNKKKKLRYYWNVKGVGKEIFRLVYKCVHKLAGCTLTAGLRTLKDGHLLPENGYFLLFNPGFLFFFFYSVQHYHFSDSVIPFGIGDKLPDMDTRLFRLST